ncbi:MAG: pyruvate dehydrogenase (acetyl-transferring) E1 component subunit alpha, partial [Chloroflexi bacterium]|nr:pyruvate dehydrogenase (acetyl-transferring) E1 component subunit alpha [Chloroflexota bacterium]
VDGMDVLAVRAASLRAVRRAREQREPTLLECVTYRFRGHSMADPGRYRSADELRKWMDRDPIAGFTLRLQEAGLLTPDEYTELDRRVQAEVQEAVDFAENSPDPDPAELARYVYAETRGA